MTLQQLVNAELEQRDELNRVVLSHVLSRCSFGKGHVKRGPLHQYVYQALGFHGQPGDHFARYMHKVLSANGIRVSYSRGQRVYYGLVWREECQESKSQEALISPDGNSEN